MTDPVFEALAKAADSGEPVALGVICRVKGSSPQKIGAKAVFYQDGRIVGTLGGGCLEAELQKRAVRALRSGTPESFDLVLDHDFGWDDGLICGGKVEGVILPQAQQSGGQVWRELAARERTLSWGVAADYSIRRLERPQACAAEQMHYLETVRPPCTLWIAGAGHIAQAVAPLAAQLDFAVTVYDDRPALASQRVFPPAVALRSQSWENLLKLALPPEGPAFGLIVTRGHRHDALVLAEWIHRPFLFLGMIGSSRKARTIFKHFEDEKLATQAELAKVACPVGISIASRTVMEIAVSIMAQFIQKRAELVRNEATDEPAELNQFRAVESQRAAPR